jgi:hypothetical protein
LPGNSILLPALVIDEPFSTHYQSLSDGKSPYFLAICAELKNSIEETVIAWRARGKELPRTDSRSSCFEKDTSRATSYAMSRLSRSAQSSANVAAFRVIVGAATATSATLSNSLAGNPRGVSGTQHVKSTPAPHDRSFHFSRGECLLRNRPAATSRASEVSR